MKNPIFVLWLIVAALLTFVLARLVDNAYFYFAGYVVLQYIVLATAWNILGGYTGYVNFGIAAFIAFGATPLVRLKAGATDKVVEMARANFADVGSSIPT